MDVRVLFLDASNEELLQRLQIDAWRTHPLLISNARNTLEEAISVERQDVFRIARIPSNSPSTPPS